MAVNLFEHRDNLDGLNLNSPLNTQLSVIHSALKIQFSFITRIAVASYDKKSGVLKTLVSSDEGNVRLVQYDADLEDAGSLLDILKTGNPRVINDLSVFDDVQKVHTLAIKKGGYAASYTQPIYKNSTLLGFVFFNSIKKNCFNSGILKILDVYSHLISSLVSHEISIINTLLAALKTANKMVHARDPETGGHSERMSRYSRLIAQDLAVGGKYKFNDEYIEHIFLFAPMHDIGKIGIPDEILLKPGKLTVREREIMQSHTVKGRELVNDMINNFELDSFQYIDILRNIAECHHEVLDGTGYPGKLKGKNIPIEARIISVADIFDALTSQRPYKLPWTNEEAYQTLQRLSSNKLDKDCVDALVNNNDKVLKIQKTFPG